ncbi:MAG: peptide/nickel transport system substrate-binding protein [Acidimicrobiaceae bacterium]|nr:peptide/nickel transport system substrate-binding protein [Acidimicrobiaceae bacterium]
MRQPRSGREPGRRPALRTRTRTRLAPASGLRSATAAAATALALVATACAGGGGGNKAASTKANKDASGPPKAGGRLIMATEAEVDGFDPTKNRFDITGLTYAETVYDPLAAYGKDGKVHPYLAESIDHSPDYTTWTIKVRSGVRFHDGDPLNADAVKATLDAHLRSPLTSPALASIASVDKADDMTVAVKMKEPWTAFPSYLTGQVGYVVSPKTLNDPNGSRHPIGTGPFTFKEWIPGNHFIAAKNPNYWQKGLPYLNEIEYRPIVEVQSRASSLSAGTIDILHTTDPDTIVAFRKDKNVKLVDDATSKGEHEESFFMLDTAKPPLDDVRVRKALAYATDRRTVVNTVYAGILPDATGPFDKNSPYANDSGYPSFDLDKAKALVAEYENEKGPITFELGTTNSAKNLQAVQLVQSQWKDAGITTTLKQVDQSQFILNALVGNYSAYLWRQFGEPDPDGDVVWWSSATAKPIGSLSLNFARNKDPEVDTALATGRHSGDPAERKAAYQSIAKRFAEDVPYVWIGTTVWAVAAKPRVQGITTWKLPDGSEGIDSLLSGRFLLSHVWTS